MNCTPFVRQYGILFRKWGVFVCQREYHKKYSGEFKIKVVETMRAEYLSCPEAAKRQSKTQVARWERSCLEEGKEALLLERRFY